MDELAKAREHAARAYNNFGNKWGRSCARELEARIKNEARAQVENARLGGTQ